MRRFANALSAVPAFRDPYAVSVRTLTWLTLGLLLVPFVLLLLLQLQAPPLELATNPFTEGDAVVISEREGHLGERWLTDLSRAITAPDP
jgi:hypothetical protein